MTRFGTSIGRTVVVATAACWWVGGSPSLANEDRWKTAASGVWSVGSNWLDGSTPANGDTALLDVAGTYTVTFNADPLAIQRLHLASGAVTFASSSFLLPSTVRVTSGTSQSVWINPSSTLTLGSPGGIFQPDKPLHLTTDGQLNVSGTLNVRFGSELNALVASVGGEGAALNVTDGSRVISGDGNIGYSFGGVANVLGNGSQWINSGTLSIGDFGSEGALLISGGGFVENFDARVGVGVSPGGGGGVGVVTVTDSGSLWKTTNSLTIGKLGTGTVNIQPGGTVHVGGQTDLHSGGRVRLQGGTLETGELSFSGGGQLEWPSGRFSVGVFHGGLGNYGTGVLAPGHSAGSTTITGFYEQRASGTLEIEVGGGAQAAEYDVVNVGGQALLDGQLDLKLINGFTPSPSQTFIIMTAGSFSGAFANAANQQRVTTVDGGGSFLVHYGAGSPFDPTLMVLSDFRAGALPGDYNQNGIVDAADYVLWRDHFGAPAGTLPNDVDGGSIGPTQYATWKANFGQSTGSGSGASANAAVPEPTTLVLLMFAVASWCLRRVRAA